MILENWEDVRALVLLFVIIIFGSGKGFVIVMDIIKSITGAE